MAKRHLSKRQIERIRTIQERRRARLVAREETDLVAAEQEEEEADTSPPEEGRVVVRHGAHLVVEGHDSELHHCLIRQNIGHPVCGDQVVWHRLPREQGLVSAIQPRQSVLSRPDYSGRDKPLAANLTRLVIVFAPEPEPGTYLLDQYLVAAEVAGIPPLLLATKMDLLDGPARVEFEARFAHYAAIGYPLRWLSLRDPDSLAALRADLVDQTTILVGQSGVGKSSLVQALLPDREIQIGRLSHATGLGRHTTSAATCYQLPSGGALIDSPGVRSFRLGQIDRDTLQHSFPEFRPHLGHCRFSDCRHEHEPECAILEAVARGDIHPERLANFQHLARTATD